MENYLKKVVYVEVFFIVLEDQILRVSENENWSLVEEIYSNIEATSREWRPGGMPKNN